MHFRNRTKMIPFFSNNVDVFAFLGDESWEYRRISGPPYMSPVMVPRSHIDPLRNHHRSTSRRIVARYLDTGNKVRALPSVALSVTFFPLRTRWLFTRYTDCETSEEKKEREYVFGEGKIQECRGENKYIICKHVRATCKFTMQKRMIFRDHCLWTRADFWRTFADLAIPLLR